MDIKELLMYLTFMAAGGSTWYTRKYINQGPDLERELISEGIEDSSGLVRTIHNLQTLPFFDKDLPVESTWPMAMAARTSQFLAETIKNLFGRNMPNFVEATMYPISDDFNEMRITLWYDQGRKSCIFVGPVETHDSLSQSRMFLEQRGYRVGMSY